MIKILEHRIGISGLQEKVDEWLKDNNVEVTNSQLHTTTYIRGSFTKRHYYLTITYKEINR